jgi:hypothetical protein
VRSLTIHAIQKSFDKTAACFRSTQDRQTPEFTGIPAQMARWTSTKWPSIKISEHIRDTRMENQRSAVAEYPAEMKHSIGFEMAEVIDNIHTYCLRLVREVIEMTEHSRNFKCKDGRRLSKARLELFLTADAT